MDESDKELVGFVVGLILWTCVVLVSLIEFIVFWLRFRGVI